MDDYCENYGPTIYSCCVCGAAYDSDVSYVTELMAVDELDFNIFSAVAIVGLKGRDENLATCGHVCAECLADCLDTWANDDDFSAIRAWCEKSNALELPFKTFCPPGLPELGPKPWFPGCSHVAAPKGGE